MRTTLELDDDLLAAARELAQQERASLGRIISELARQSLAARMPQEVRNGAVLFPPRAGSSKSNLRIVNKLRDDD